MSETLYLPRFGTGSTVAVQVDPEDFDRFCAENWFVQREDYCQRIATVSERAAGLPKTLRMHRLILAAPVGMSVDHINGDRLDNRKANLRLCTVAQNNQNLGRLSVKNTTGERGVFRSRRKWLVSLACRGVRTYYGTFDTFEAAVAHKRAVEAAVYGEFASARIALNGVA